MTYGWLVIIPGMQPMWGCGIVPPKLLAQFNDRKTQIMAGEMLAALSALFSTSEYLRGRRVLHFIDNIGGLAALVGGKSSAEDLSSLATLYQMLIVTLGVRAWREYVESDANVSDGPSRLLDAWSETPICNSLGAKQVPCVLPDITSLLTPPLDELKRFPLVRNL